MAAITLDETNYQEWVEYMEDILRREDLLSHVNGTRPCPAASAKEWLNNDARVLAILVEKVSVNILTEIMKLPKQTSQQLWVHLQAQYQSSSCTAREKLYSLLQKFRSLEQKDSSVEDFSNKFTSLRGKIDSTDPAFPLCFTCKAAQEARCERHLLYDFLSRLHPDLQDMKMVTGPFETIKEVLPALMEMETQRKNTDMDLEHDSGVGVDDDAPDELSRCVLKACTKRDLTHLERLLTPNIERTTLRVAKDNNGQTAMHIAAMNGDHQILNILVEHGYDINIKNGYNGGTPLQAALDSVLNKISPQQQECIDILLKKNPNYSLMDNDGNNVFQIAAQRALSPSGPSGGRLHCQNLQKLILQMLKCHGASPILDKKNYRGYTLADLLYRLPQNWILPELKNELARRGVDVKCDEIQMEMGYLPELDEELDKRRLESVIAENKLEDASNIGTQDCTLILTEGDSANSFAKKGVQCLGMGGRYGTYCFCGKLPSSRGTMLENKQVLGILVALGLKFKYSKKAKAGGRRRSRKEELPTPVEVILDMKKLRYRHLMIMMDADPDGCHLKALLINILYTLCPEILKIPMFILDFNTYLYKATHLVTKEVKTFKFSHDYQSWVNGKGKLASEWKIIYLKGLATNDFSAVLEYFVDFEDYTRHIFWSGDIDGNNIETAFSDLTSNDKRTWILEHEQGLYDTTISDPTISFSDFMKKELVLYFMESNKRTMPSIMDGLKVSSRKIMFALMEKDKRTRWKIHDLASFVSREVVYHHRSQSLENTIFRMAVNSMLLKEASLYEDAKGIGYLDVEIHPIADLIFPKVDFRFLKYMCEDGKQVQPQFYSSIIPLVLVDGCKGIGTGYKTNIYKYNIEDIITNLRRLLDNEENNEVKLPLLDMMPILPGYKGNIIKDKEKDGIYFSLGKCRLEEDNNTILIIEQLPYKVGYEAYEKCLNDLKKFKVIRGFNKINESETSQYKVFLTKSIDEIDDSTMSRFYLKRPLPASSIYLYNAKGVLQYYSSPEKVVEEFFIERMKIYRKRKEHLELMTSETDLFRQDLDLLDAKLVELAREKKDEEATTNKAIEEARKKRDQYEDQYEDSHT